jgi:outer membrane lipase/esterase
MSFNWKRRVLLALASASALLVAACGSGTIESQLQPSRIVAFGDGMADLGQVGGRRYTVNDNTVNVWTQDMASRFGMPLAAAAAGGTSFATGNARVIAKPDAAGSAATPTVAEQINGFLAGGGIGPNDLMVVSGGTADIVAEMARVTAGAQTGEQMIANVAQAGRDLAAQVRRLVQAGGAHVVVSGPYNLGRSPWATAIGQVGLLQQASTKFNEELLVALVDQGANVLYVDAALFFNLMEANPAGYDLANVTQGVCTSVDPGPGIGIGIGQVNSALCDTTTLGSTEYNRFMFADPIYPAPQSHRRFGQYAYDRIHARW